MTKDHVEKNPREGQDGDKSELTRNMEKALAMKQNGAGDRIPEDRTAHQGMQPLPNEAIAPSGAFGAEGERPVLSRSRGVRKSDRG